jgi:hypothetical protein
MARPADLRPLTRRAAALLAVVLGLALGVAQMAGHAHRIAHAHGQEHHDCETEHAHALALFAPSDVEHSCAAFDAATLGDGPPATAALEQARVPVGAPAVLASPAPSCIDCWPDYLSRAPPRA